MDSLSFATSSAAGGLWIQLQRQQAERTASQASQKAMALRAQAGEAQDVADRARENARSLKVQSEQAQEDANLAQLSLATAKSVGKVQQEFSTRHLQPTIASSDVAPISAAASGNANPSVVVINTQGQPTGGLVNVTA